jgi:uncharacterized surface protein with fasciclin (FAS1) repeats
MNVRTPKLFALAGVLAVSSLLATACGDDDDDAAASGSQETEQNETTTTAADDSSGAADMDDDATAADSSEICDPDELVEAVESGGEEGTLQGMTDDPVGTAASNNPVLTTLTTAVTEAGLVDTLNSAESLTVFAPTDCAFAALDEETLNAALADPTGLLTQVLGFHVVAGERLSGEDLAGVTELQTFSGATLPVAVDGDVVSIGGDQATVVVPDIQTANATVHLIDAVMLPPAG